MLSKTIINSLLAFGSEFHEVCFNEVVEFAVEDAGDIGGLVVGAVVLDAAVVHDVGAYLAAPFNLLLAGLDFVLLLHAVLTLVAAACTHHTCPAYRGSVVMAEVAE